MSNEYKVFTGDFRHDMLQKYTERIESCLKDITFFFDLYKHYQIKTPPPCATNYRDALFHYLKLYNADEQSEAITQASNIDEHLDRLVKDSYINFLQILIRRMKNEYEHQQRKDRRKCLQRGIHMLKDLVLVIRSDSLQIRRFFQSPEGLNVITERFTMVSQDIKRNNLFYVLTQS